MKPLAMWGQWQQKVRDGLPDFCRSPLYVAQEIPVERFEEVADYIKEHCPIEVWGKTLGEEYGATVVETVKLGRVTRMWMDAMCEVNFLARFLSLRTLDVLDIGAGYGRLAAAMADMINTYTCTDAVPISQFVCEYFTMKHCPSVAVRKPENLLAGPDYNLAINIHSWSEASLESIEEWLFILNQKGTRFLFTVPHDDNYLSWGDGSFRPLIEKEYELMEEAKFGLCNHPHSLWRRR